MSWRKPLVIGASVAAFIGLLRPAVAAAPLPESQATTTTVTASPTSSGYDSTVTVTAHVSAGTGIPAGFVTFTDTSNGSILDTAKLKRGGAKFATAALAPGTRTIVASYAGNSIFGPSSSRAVGVSVASAGSDAVTYQIDPRHDGHQARGRLKARSLTRKWTVTLGVASNFQPEAGDVSYPLIARGRVFVTVENSRRTGTQLYALSAKSGAVDWSVGLGGIYGFSALAYDGRRVFALDYNGILTAFDASTGHELWAAELDQFSFTSPPTAYDGVVYVSGSGDSGTVYAVSEADGVVRWEVPVLNGDHSSPAVDSSGAYVSYSCQQDYRFTLGGRLAWHYGLSCEGGGGSTAVLHAGSVYARGETPIILSKSSGVPVGAFTSATTPAFSQTTMYTLQNGNLVAVAPSGSPNRWTFKNGRLVTAPVVIGGTVYVGSSSGKVYGVSAASGARVWTGTAGSKIVAPDEFANYILTGMAAGGGLLVVAAGTRLTAFSG